MQYFQEVWDLVCLKDEAYRKIGNDKSALRRLVTYFIIVSYITITLVMLILGFFVGIIAVSAGKLSLLTILLVVLLAILFLPWLGIIFDIFFGWLNHIFAVLIGGKARFWDFYKVYHYPKPLMMIIGIVPLLNMLLYAYFVWDFIFLYKSLINIHKLTPKQAGWFVGIKAGIIILGAVVLFILYFAFIFYSIFKTGTK